MECGRLRGPYSSAQTSQIQPGLRESIVDFGEGEEGEGGRAAESLSLSQKKGRRKLGLVREEEKFWFFDPAALLMDDQPCRFRKVDVSFSRSPKTLIFLIIHRDSIRKGFRPCGNPQSPIENERERSKDRPRFRPDPRTSDLSCLSNGA